MATYPIKMLKDEDNIPFVPLVSTDSVQYPDGVTLEDKLKKKLEASNVRSGSNITIVEDDNGIVISASGEGTLIDNLDTTVPGMGALDARQGNILKNKIPDVVDELSDTSITKALSAKQGYVLNQKIEDNKDKNYYHNQTVASDVWTIIHNLNKYPSVTVLDSSKSEVIGDVIYDSLNQVTIKFSGAFKGSATLN